VRAALQISDQLVPLLAALGPQTDPLREQVERIKVRLQQADELLDELQRSLATTTAGSGDALGLEQTRGLLQSLLDAITAFTDVPPEVVVAPLAVETQFVARLEPDFITFYAPAIMALLLQHVAVSLGSLALVRERLSGTFDLFVVAPITNLQLLIGKYLAYLFFTLTIATLLLVVLMAALGVPLFGSAVRVACVLVLLAISSVGLGFLLSILASSERQAVQFSMLALLSIVFFSGFALPIKALRQPALSLSYALPATYGGILLQDIMLRGLPGRELMYLALIAIGLGLFLACLAGLAWRTHSR
jgi:ABC-2 type transport system permease protein